MIRSEQVKGGWELSLSAINGRVFCLKVAKTDDSIAALTRSGKILTAVVASYNRRTVGRSSPVNAFSQ